VKKEKETTENILELSMEEAFQRLDVLSAKLEERETSLEDSFLYYKEGMELLKICSEKLDTVEKKMLQMNEDGTLSEFSRGISDKNEGN
jgi:exodeoxyribonuclease VII small subunit